MTVASGVARGVASAVTRGQGASGTASLDIRASVGTSTPPTSNGPQNITGIPFQPKLILPWWVGNAGVSTEVAFSFGAAVSTSSRAAIAVGSRNAVTTTATHRRHDNTKLLTDAYNGSTGAAADLTSFNSDGATLAWNPTVGATQALQYMFLGGADLEVSLTQQQMSNSNSPQAFAHGLSGAPTGVLFFSSFDAATSPSTITGIQAAIGAWAGGNQFAAAITSRNGLTTTGTRRVLSNAAVLSYPWTDGTNNKVMNVGSVDATNVNVTYTNGDATAHRIYMLAFRGAKCQVGTFDCNGSTSPLTIATTGITPKLFLPVFVPDGVASIGTVLLSNILAIGASDGTNNVSCGISDSTAVTTTNARRWQSSTSLAEYTTAGALGFEATAAFSGESVVVTPTLAGAGRGQAGYIVLGS